jgi:uncharacterized protein
MSGALPGVQDDTLVHVAQLLQEQVGAVRQCRIAVEVLPLDEGMVAHKIVANVRLTRIPTGILAKGQLDTSVRLECSRCLDEYDQSLEVEFADEYRPTIDIVTGAELSEYTTEDEAEYFTISDIHVLDLRESIRQAIVLELPMAPICREDCPGLPEAAGLNSEGDARLAVLGRLLVDEDAE